MIKESDRLNLKCRVEESDVTHLEHQSELDIIRVIAHNHCGHKPILATEGYMRPISPADRQKMISAVDRLCEFYGQSLPEPTVTHDLNPIAPGQSDTPETKAQHP